MNRERFDTYVNEIELRAQRDPGPIRRKTRWLVFLGYLVIATLCLSSIVLVLVVGFLALLKPNAATIKIALFVGIPSAILCFSLLRSLFVKMGRPEGIAITREDAPRVFQLLDDISVAASARDGEQESGSWLEESGAVTFDEVLITPDFNAAVAQVPRLGIFGWYKRYLILGLPLLQTVDLDEFKAILAHEFAHLSGQHGRFGSWVYRTRATWETVVYSLSEDGSWGATLINKFLGWFWPRFNGHAFALSRGQEYEADAFAANYAGKDNLASALSRIEVEARTNELAWETLSKRLEHEASAPTEVYHEIERLQTADPDESWSRKWLAESFLRPTDTSDTHPSLSDRIAAVGVEFPEEMLDAARSGKFDVFPVVTSVAKEDSALTALLDPSQHSKFLDVLNKDWFDGASPNWEAAHKEAKSAAEELEKLGELKDGASKEERVEYHSKRLVFHLDRGDDIQALEEAEILLALDSELPLPNLVKARVLLEKDDPAGVGILEELITREPLQTGDFLDMLYDYHSRRGDSEGIKEIKRRADAHDELVERAQMERASFTVKDEVLNHSMSEKDVSIVRKVLEEHVEVVRVYAVRKQVEIFPEALPMVVLAVEVKSSKMKLKSSDWQQVLVSEIVEKIEPEKSAFFYAFTKAVDKKVFKTCVEFEGALIYEKES